jgi:cardiolipin synthase C
MCLLSVSQATNTPLQVQRTTVGYFILGGLWLLGACSTSDENNSHPEKDFCAEIHRSDSTSLSKELLPLESLMTTKTGVYVLEDGGGSLVARAWLSEYAEQTIDVQYFIFSTDNVGLIACDYLVRAADRGVKVRILVDDILVDAGIRDILTLDSHANISIKIYNPGVNLGKNFVGKLKSFALDYRSSNQRMHNKTFIVDGKALITGGRNIADEYFDYDHDYNFRDRDVLLLGKTVGNAEYSFDQFWNDSLSVDVAAISDELPWEDAPNGRFTNLHSYACDPDNFWPQIRSKIEGLPKAFEKIQADGSLVWLDSVLFVSDVPGKNDGTEGLSGGGLTTDTLMALIRGAKRSIDIQTPYLITTEESRNLFAECVDRGVTVRILTNSLASTDNLEAFSGYQRDRKELLETGVRIFEFKPDAAARFEVMTSDLQDSLQHQPIFGLHAKSMVVDGHITVIGTFNLDPRSSNLNTECVTVIYSDQIASGVAAHMETEFKPENAWETTLDFNPDSEVPVGTRIKVWTRKVVPKNIL